jgi:hypothetical protein
MEYIALCGQMASSSGAPSHRNFRSKIALAALNATQMSAAAKNTFRKRIQ